MQPLHYVFLAGINNSEPEHWQSIWNRELTASSTWVEQRDWQNPDRDEWVAALERALRTPERKLIIAHSMGCLVAAEAAEALARHNVCGAFLVAVPDVAGPHFPNSARGFRGALASRMPVPSVVVASLNDPYGSLEHSQRVAEHWGSKLVCVGERGHINLASNLGEWPEGRALLRDFVQRA